MGHDKFTLGIFFKRKFYVHRIFGLCFILQWFATVYNFVTDYENYASTIFVWSLPCNGILQSVTAAYYFRHLPSVKRLQSSGFFDDRFSIAYEVVVENIFYSSRYAFQALYLNYNWNNSSIPLMLVEQAWVFFPYVIRKAFPRTSMRSNFKDVENKHALYWYGIWVVKFGILWNKHVHGYYLNYKIFLDEVNNEMAIYRMRLLHIFLFWAVTVSFFFHTLKFKKMIGLYFSFGLYVVVVFSVVFTGWNILQLFIHDINPLLLGIIVVGAVNNIVFRDYQNVYQIFVCLALNYVRSQRDIF